MLKINTQKNHSAKITVRKKQKMRTTNNVKCQIFATFYNLISLATSKVDAIDIR